ncbi:MAG: TldD/PmbA family protein [Candidatus Zixiibacteriota bacterium]|nr:MAG: TldD/PmbA family protein [candidate division Zixibacteria bacterium]
MNRKESFELARWSVDRAKKEGADDCAAYLLNKRKINISHRDRKLDELKESTQNSLSLSVYADNRYSNHSTNDIRRESLARFIEEAVAMTKYLNEDPDRSLPDPKYYDGQSDIDLQIFDPGYEDVKSSDRVRLAREIEEAALTGSDRIISCTAEYSDTYSQAVRVHSNGFEGEHHSTVFDAEVKVSVKGMGDSRPGDSDYSMVRYLKDLSSPEDLGKRAVERALRKVGQAKIESGVYDMIVENRAASRLVYPWREPMTGRALHRKNSFLEGKLGQQIASDRFTIIDDPFVRSGLGSRLFDGEGMATRKRDMIDKGILKSYYINCYYGRKLGTEPTIGSPTNLVFDYGSKSLDDLIKQTKKGILVTGFIGGNSNDTTGDFSYGIMGILIENGSPVKPVSEMNISGNMLEFWNQLVEVGNDPWPYSSIRRPSMFFRGVQFSGI